MSREGLEALRRALSEEESLRARLAQADSVEEVCRIAAEAGFVVTVDDLTGEESDLTDAELQAAAGGGHLLPDTEFPVCMNQTSFWTFCPVPP